MVQTVKTTFAIKSIFMYSKGGYIMYVGGGGGRRVLQIFQKIFRSPGDHRPKYFMDQYFFRTIFHGPSHQF